MADEGAIDSKTGPKTARGKARVRLNPVKHAVLSQTPVIPLVEKKEDWLRLRAGVFESVQPVGMLEELFADRIAYCFWRLFRSVRHETESISGYLESVPGDWRFGRAMRGLPEPGELTEEHVEEMSRMLMKRLLPGDETLTKVMRYETKVHRFLLQTMHQLLVLQNLRKRGRWGSPMDVPSSDRQQSPMLPEGLEVRGRK